MSLILAIETSCDETAAAVVRDGVAVLSSVVASQHELHERYRGVVPEIASRAHLENIMPVIVDALSAAAKSEGLDGGHPAMFPRLSAVAVGNRPGLIGSLLVGVSAAKALSWSLGVPLLGIDHIQAHLYAAALHFHDTAPALPPLYPALGLVVSGGHTSMYEVESPLTMRLMGKTIDDAVGEAYDKAAVILGVPYPGGPLLDKLAQRGDAGAVEPLPRSMLDAESLDFSFSGLKTSLLYRVRGHPVGRGTEARFERSESDLSESDRVNLAAAFQEAAVDAVMTKLTRGLAAMARAGRPARSLVVGGGVSANSRLRARCLELGRKRGLRVCLPLMPFCVDNAAMIAGLAHQALAAGQADDLDLPAIATTRA